MNSENSLGMAIMGICFVLFLVIAVAVGISHDPEPDMLRTIESYGMTQPRIVGPGSVIGSECGDDYWYEREFEASNAAGRRVRGYVCCGYSKRCTIKF